MFTLHRLGTSLLGISLLGTGLLACTAVAIRPATAAATAAATGRSPTDGPRGGEAGQLVNQLGDGRFSNRERATERLIQLGVDAIGALEQGMSSQDREISYRSMHILTLVRELDFQRRLQLFASDPEGGGGNYDLPGWDRFQQQVGSAPEARLVFVEMQRAEPELMRSVGEGAAAVARTLARSAQQFSQQQLTSHGHDQVTAGAVAAHLFAGLQEEVPITPQVSMTIFTYCYNANFRTALDDGETSDVLRKLLGEWIRRSRDLNAYQGMALAMQHELVEGLVPAEAILRQAGGQPNIRQYALLAVAKLGSDPQLPLVESLFDDKTLCASRRVEMQQREVQLRDVALAAALHLRGKDPRQFGFDLLQLHQTVVFDPGSLSFADEQTRQAAFEKYARLGEE